MHWAYSHQCSQTLFSGHYFHSKRRWKLPGTLDHEACNFAPSARLRFGTDFDLVGPGAHNLDEVLKVTLLLPSFMERDTLERMGPNLASASGTRPFSKGAYTSSFPMVCSCSVETGDRVQSGHWRLIFPLSEKTNVKRPCASSFNS